VKDKEPMRRPLLVPLLWGTLVFYLFWPLALGIAHLVPFHLLAGDPALEGVDTSADRPDWRTYDLAPLTTFYAEKSLVASGLRRGELPLWNPNSGLGIPLLADGQSQPLAPFFLPFLVAPNPWVYSLCLVAQLLWGGLGMDRFLKAMSAGTLARTTGAALFAFSPFALKYMAFNNMWAAAWFPWLFLCAERMATSGRRFWTMGWIVSLTAMSGHPEEAFLGAVAAWLYYLVRAWRLGGLHRDRLLTAWPLVPPVAAALFSAWWVLPFLEWVGLSTSERMHVFKPIPYGWEAPFLLGSELLLPPLLLALALLGAVRFRASLAMIPALLWSALLLFPVPQALQVALSLGFMSNRYGRSLAWFTVVALGAVGLDALAKSKLARAEAWGGLVLFAAWIAGAVTAAVFAGGEARGSSGHVPLGGNPVATSWTFCALLALGVLVWIAAWLGGERTRRAAPSGIAACLLAGIILAPPSTWVAWNRSAPKLAAPLTSPAPETSGREWFPAVSGLQCLSPNLSAAFGVKDLRYVLPLTPRRLLPLAQPLQWGFSGFYAPSDETLEVCGVARRWSVVPAGGGNPPQLEARALSHALPRGFWVGDATAVPDAKTGIHLALDNGSWRQRAFLEGLAPVRTEMPSRACSSAEALTRLVQECSNASTWRVECPKAGWFVLRDLYWPGWRAEVDGIPAPVYAADGVFRAVPVPGGSHTITFGYSPAVVFWGGTISLATVLVVVVGALAVRYGKAKRPGRSQ
jgi:hypothetical protein